MKQIKTKLRDSSKRYAKELQAGSPRVDRAWIRAISLICRHWWSQVASKTAECERLQKAMEEQRKLEEAAKEAMEKLKKDSKAECDSLMSEVSNFRTKLARSQALILLYRQKVYVAFLFVSRPPWELVASADYRN